MAETIEPALKAALLPCPFCGSAVTLEHSKDAPSRLFIVKCSSESPCIGSGLGGFYILEDQLADGVAAWNRRASPQAEIDRLREALRDLYAAFLSKHGCFPLDRVTPEQRAWNDAMLKANAVLHPENPNGDRNG